MSRTRWGIAFGLGLAVTAAAQTPAPAPKRPVYVEDFQAHTGDSSGGSGRSGPLSRLRGEQSSMKATQSAGALSGAIASEFQKRGFSSQRIARDATLPTKGWLVTGIFYAMSSQGKMIQMPTFLTGKSDPPNTDVTVTVADLASDPNSPFIVFGLAEALRGQGPPAGWNPYVVAAKFVINKVESASDIQKLAGEIVDTIMKNQAVIEQKAPQTAAR